MVALEVIVERHAGTNELRGARFMPWSREGRVVGRGVGESRKQVLHASLVCITKSSASTDDEWNLAEQQVGHGTAVPKPCLLGLGGL